MTFINSFYLEFDSKRDAFPAILNMLQLNFDNFLDTNDDSKVSLLTKESAKQAVKQEPYSTILTENLKQLAVELLFI